MTLGRVHVKISSRTNTLLSEFVLAYLRGKQQMSSATVATRLTCFALISAMESDLRLAIREVAERSARVDLLPLDVRRNAAGRWEKDNESREGEHAESDLDLLGYVDFADLAKILYTNAGDFSRIGPQTVHDIADRLVRLAPARNRVCHSRPLEPEDFAELYDLARELSTRYKIVGWPEIDATLTRLESEPSYVLRLVIPTFWSSDISDIHHNLPDPEFDDTGFLGRVADRKELHCSAPP